MFIKAMFLFLPNGTYTINPYLDYFSTQSNRRMTVHYIDPAKKILTLKDKESF